MTKIHEKSPCCRGNISRYGGRRRQCEVCRGTWSVWKKKRGRKRFRISAAEAIAFIMHRHTPVRKHTGTRNQRQYRLARSRNYLIAHTPWPAIPPGRDLIVIADALVKYLGKRWHTWYFIFVRPVDDDAAIVLPPFHRLGTEVAAGWREAFAAVDPVIVARIKAMVCDGHRGLVSEARWSGWKLQRCHFHLIARLQSRRSKWYTGRYREEGRHIYALTKQALTEPDASALNPIMNEIEEIGWTNTSPEVRNVLSGFVSNIQDYRTYLLHPELHLPITNNTAETFIGLVEELSRRGRGFRTVAAFHAWIAALIKTRKTIHCRPNHQQN